MKIKPIWYVNVKEVWKHAHAQNTRRLVGRVYTAAYSSLTKLELTARRCTVPRPKKCCIIRAKRTPTSQIPPYYRTHPTGSYDVQKPMGGAWHRFSFCMNGHFSQQPVWKKSFTLRKDTLRTPYLIYGERLFTILNQKEHRKESILLLYCT